MHVFIRTTIGCALLLVNATAAQPAFHEDPAADKAWQELIAIAPPVPQPRSNSPESAKGKTREKVTPEKAKLDKQRYEKAERDARAFYLRYPNHGFADAAKKLEVLAALAGTPADNSARDKAATKLAADYRADSSVPPVHRFDVALALERRARVHKTAGHGDVHDGAELEKMADALRRDFGDLPAVYAIYEEAMLTGAARDAERVAARMLQLPAPPSTRDEANAVLARAKLKGKTVHVQLRDTNGNRIELWKPVGTPTVLYFSRPGDTFLRDERGAKNPTRWIHITLGTTDPAKEVVPPGFVNSVVRCVEPGGFASRIGRYLKVREAPFVAVLDEKGFLRAWGPVAESHAVLAAIGR